MAEPALHVVATPIGNLSDLSPRAAQTLGTVDVVLAEDTRRSRALLASLDIHRPLISLHEHNEHERTGEVLELLRAGKSAALVTDAGTPAVSDPGSRLVRAVAAAGVKVTPCAGPSALTAILSIAGFEASSAGVLFLEFLPAKGRPRTQALFSLGRHQGVVVLFEAPHRIQETLRDLADLDAERDIVIGRELTKMHEEIWRGRVSDATQWAAGEIRGELTLALGPQLGRKGPPSPDAEATLSALVRCLDAGLTGRDAAAAVAVVLERPRREVYELCQQILRERGK